MKVFSYSGVSEDSMRIRGFSQNYKNKKKNCLNIGKIMSLWISS